MGSRDILDIEKPPESIRRLVDRVLNSGRVLTSATEEALRKVGSKERTQRKPYDPVHNFEHFE